MDSVKLAACLAGSILILLLAILVFTKKPEKELYDETMETVMFQEGLTSVEEVMDNCPELESIQQQMHQIQRLNSDIHSLTAGPAPNVSEAQSEELLAMTKEVQELRMEVKKGLTELMDGYGPNQSTGIMVQLYDEKQN